MIGSGVKLPMRFLLPFALTAVTLGGCGEERHERPDFAERDSMGVRIAENALPPRISSPTWTLSSEPDIVLGAAIDGPPEQQFGAIVGLLALSSGTLAVADGEAHEIRYFAPDGRHLQTSGGYGAGPGEFRQLASIVSRADTVFAFDPLLGRVTQFDPEGRYIGDYSLKPHDNARSSTWLYRLGGVTADGYFVLYPIGFFGGLRDRRGLFWAETGYALVFDRAGDLLLEVGEVGGMDVFSTDERSGAVIVGRVSAADYFAGQLVMTDGLHYEARIYEGTKTPTRIIRVDASLRPVTSEDVANYIERRVGTLGASDQARAREIMESVPRADRLPWVATVRFDLQGYVWVQEYSVEAASTRWSVFAPDGRWVAYVEIPPKLSVFQIGSDYILASGRGNLDAPYVVVHRLRRAQ